MALDDVYLGNTGGDGGDKHGYNPQNVIDLSNDISTAYENCCTGIVETLHDEIVTPISTAWYAPEACKFFGSDATDGILGIGAVQADENSLKEVVKKTSETIFKCFDGFRQDIESAGQNWFNNTSGAGESTGDISLPTFKQIDLELDVSAIQDKDGEGNVVLDGSAVKAVSDKLADVQESIKTKMTAEKDKLDAATSFIGGGQATAIEGCFERLLEAISTIFKWLSEGDESLQSAFNAAMQKYSDVASNIASAYNEATFDDAGQSGGGTGTA